jgi:protein SPA2
MQKELDDLHESRQREKEKERQRQQDADEEVQILQNRIDELEAKQAEYSTGVGRLFRSFKGF